MADLRAAFPDLTFERLGPDLGMASSETVSVTEISKACGNHMIPFVRHLTEEQMRLGGEEASRVDLVAECMREIIVAKVKRGAVAVQLWSSGDDPRVGLKSGELISHLTEALEKTGVSIRRSGTDSILSACWTTRGLVMGFNQQSLSLSDWPGGRMRLAKDSAQLSRAEFKLEEAFALFDIDVGDNRRALDLGASPGGWTRVLRKMGLSVWAVDPGDLDPTLQRDPQVHHFPTTAGAFLNSQKGTFGMAVNDMRMPPELSSSLMLEFAAILDRKAPIVLTLKLRQKRPRETIADSLKILSKAYNLRHVRQLYHNRHEITVIATRK